jgi:serine/threonine protein kinase
MKPDPILALEGRDLGGGWTVGKLVKAGPVGSGGNFSICYLARKDNEIDGFVKVFDFRSAIESPDLMRELQYMTSSYNYERDLLDYCRDNKIRKVVIALKHGNMEVVGLPLDRAYYIVFELADGDARSQLENGTKRSLAWVYLALQNVATALRGMHAKSIFHQDLKPSNVLVFNSGNDNKVSDLGRSHRESSAPPHDFVVPGFIAYAPPEQLYGYELPDSRRRRAAADIYELGSLLLFFFTGVMATPAIFSQLHGEHLPAGDQGWTGTYSDVLPYLDAAYATVVEELEVALKDEIPLEYHSKFIPATLHLFRMLTSMRPEERGHPQTRRIGASSPYDLERIISEFAHLSKMAVLVDRINAAAA